MRKYSLPKRVLKTNDLLSIKLSGIWYGYPSCCTKWWSKNVVTIMKDGDIGHQPFLGSGLLLCPECRTRDPEVILKEIAERRVCPQPFPNGSYYNADSNRWALKLLSGKVTHPRVTDEDLEDIREYYETALEEHRWYRDQRAERLLGNETISPVISRLLKPDHLTLAQFLDYWLGLVKKDRSQCTVGIDFAKPGNGVDFTPTPKTGRGLLSCAVAIDDSAFTQDYQKLLDAQNEETKDE